MIDLRQDKGHIFVKDSVVLSLHIDSWKVENHTTVFFTLGTKISQMNGFQLKLKTKV